MPARFTTAAEGPSGQNFERIGLKSFSSWPGPSIFIAFNSHKFRMFPMFVCSITYEQNCPIRGHG